MEWQKTQEGGVTFEWGYDDGVFFVQFQAPKRLCLHPEFGNMVWDQVLRLAHTADFIPIGPVIHEIEEAPTQRELVEGMPVPIMAVTEMMTVKASVIC